MVEKKVTKKDLEDEMTEWKRLSEIVYKKERTLKEANEVIDAYKESIGCLIQRDISETKICIERYHKDE